MIAEINRAKLLVVFANSELAFGTNPAPFPQKATHVHSQDTDLLLLGDGTGLRRSSAETRAESSRRETRHRREARPEEESFGDLYASEIGFVIQDSRGIMPGGCFAHHSGGEGAQRDEQGRSVECLGRCGLP